jgi:t-SNARE complex subunit (syntaxin)
LLSCQNLTVGWLEHQTIKTIRCYLSCLTVVVVVVSVVTSVR